MKQNITEEILINEANWISITREVFFVIIVQEEAIQYTVG